MTNSQIFRELARVVSRRGQGEIGMHLHAWDSPPHVPEIDDSYPHMPYLIEYPEHHLRGKVKAVTEVLESTFGVKMVSHRAGRWSFDEVYARALAEQGYLVDCSVTPHVSWQDHKGTPEGHGGSDFSTFPESAYFLDLEDISRPGKSDLLEVPMTIVPLRWGWLVEQARPLLERLTIGQRVMRRLFPRDEWLRPNGRNRRSLLRILSTASQNGRDYVEFMLHSSELMPGGSPMFPTAAAIDSLYDDIEVLFQAARGRFEGLTLSEYYRRYRERRASDPGAP